jgi:hypothetical protein
VEWDWQMKPKYWEKYLPLCHLFTTEPTYNDTSLNTIYVVRKSTKYYWEIYLFTAKDLLFSATYVKNSAFARTLNYYPRSQTYEKRLLDSSCPSVCFSFCMKKLGCHCTEFKQICYLSIFRNWRENSNFFKMWYE